MAEIGVQMGLTYWLMVATLTVSCLALAGVLGYRLRRVAVMTEQIRAELQASEERYRLLAENASDVIWTIRYPELTYSYISPSITRLRGISVEAAKQESFPDSVVPEQREWIRRLIDNRVKRFQRGNFDALEAQRVEVRQQCIDDHEITVEIIASLIVNEANEVIGIQGSSRNITARKRAELARMVRESILGALAHAARVVFNATDKDAAMDEALSRLGLAVGADRVYVFENHIDPDSGQLLASMRYEWVGEGILAQIDNPDMQHMPYDQAIPNWRPALEGGEAVHGLVATMPEPERQLAEDQGIVSIVVVPIFMEGEFWGQIGFDDCTREHQWSQAEIDALNIAASTIGAAIHGIRSEQKLKHLVNTDSLTGLCSRRIFLETAREAHRRTLESGDSMGLLIMDLDHFKTVNDNHGHPVGDDALKAFARVCRQALRDTDLVGRMGGEEFAVLLEQVDRNRALSIAEKLRSEVASNRFHCQGIGLDLSVSIGLAMSQSGDADFSALLKRADQALYRAKNGGRNRVETG